MVQLVGDGGVGGRVLWRRGWDSNPRNGFPFTAFPVLPVQPLLHLSIVSILKNLVNLVENCLPQKSLTGLTRFFRINKIMAERVGFEPTVGVNPLRFSRP